MSWVLILNSDGGRGPAVIGGYKTLEEAVNAGLAATDFTPWDQLTNPHVRMPLYNHFEVIPGAACNEPSRSVHSRVDRDPDACGKLIRYTQSFG